MTVVGFLLLVGSVLGQELPVACRDNSRPDYYVNGYNTGLAIEMDYAKTKITKDDVTHETQLTVAFSVPRLYTEQYEGAAFAITFDRKHNPVDNTSYSGDELWKNKVDVGLETEDGTNSGACYTNLERKYDNRTTCEFGERYAEWIIAQNDNDECLSNVEATVPWAKVLSLEDRWFGEYAIKDNGDVTEVFLTSTVETWNWFTETAGENYKGQMTGSEDFLNGDLGDPSLEQNRKGEYGGDGGDIDRHFLPLTINDYRYSLYQIPFILRFPKTTVVETNFVTGSRILFVAGVVQQDTIDINIDPDSDVTEDTFGVVDVTISTEVQYPYGIRGPQDAIAPMKKYIGDTNEEDAQTEIARAIEFQTWDPPSSCNHVKDSEMCVQNFKLRIWPHDNTPCTVAGVYTLEYWATCVNLDTYHAGGPNAGCSIDDFVEDPDIAVKRQSNSYFEMTFQVDHQDFCPEIMDTVKVVADFSAYHDEGFTQLVDNTNEDYWAYTNDIIYYEVSYRTTSEKAQSIGGAPDIRDNELDTFTEGTQQPTNEDGVIMTSTDEIIDYVRATKIFTTITIGYDFENEQSLDGWQNDGTESTWVKNLSWSLGGSRISGDDFGVDDHSLQVLFAPNCDPINPNHTRCKQAFDKSQYEIVLCEASVKIDAGQVLEGDKPDDCFDEQAQNAYELGQLYLDFDKVMKSSGTANTIDENEIAFKIRLDERLMPVGPETDFSHLKMTVQAEVYYKGNLHPTRRLMSGNRRLQDQDTTESQRSINTLVHGLHYRGKSLVECPVNEQLETGSVKLTLDYGGNFEAAPSLQEVTQWSNDLGDQLNKHYNLPSGVIEVVEVEYCDTRCRILMSKADVKSASRRRIQSSSSNVVHITIRASSTFSAYAGQIINALQSDMVAKVDYDKVGAFSNAEITDMDALDCGDQPSTSLSDFWNRERSVKSLDSSARPFVWISSLIVGVMSLML